VCSGKPRDLNRVDGLYDSLEEAQDAGEPAMTGAWDTGVPRGA
jgi:hypothetical protein